MANVQHSGLTGSDLHECKGAASAASGQVPVATGTGTAPFTVLSYTQLSNTPIPKLQLNGTPSSGQVTIKVYTTTATAGAWSVSISGYTTVWAVYASCVDGTPPYSQRSLYCVFKLCNWQERSYGVFHSFWNSANLCNSHWGLI